MARSRVLRRPAPEVVFAGWLLLGLLSGCVDEVDRAAKQRIFSPEEPKKEVLAASQPIEVEALGRDPEKAYRVLTMTAAEALERLGPHRYAGTASFEWSYQGRKVKLSEKRTLALADAETYHVATESDRDQGLEILCLGGRTFARSKYHPFRERKRDRGHSAKVLEDVYGGLSSAESLLGHRLALTPDGAERVGGRAARRVLFGLTKDPIVAAHTTRLPPIQFPAGGPDADTQRRLDFVNLSVPRSVEGQLWVDDLTGVPLKADLSAIVSAPGEQSDEAKLAVRVAFALEAIGDKPALEEPKTFLPDDNRPNGIAAALKRFDVVPAVDGGTPESIEEPADE